MERKGIRTERGNINRAIGKYNAMIMKIYGFISELKEELKKGVFKFVFERKSRTERDDIQSINPSINPSVPEQKSEVQTALEILKKQRTEMVVGPIFPYVQRFEDKRLLGNVEQLAKLIDTNHLETWEDMDEIGSMVKELVDTYEVVQDAEVLMKPAYAPLGKCPHCGADVIEKSKGFFCENKDCKFALWKDNRFFDSLSKKLTKQVAEQLLSRGRAKLKKCRSVKTGKTYDTTVVLSVSDNGAPQFTLDFSKGAK